MTSTVVVLQAVAATSALVIGLFFLRFWHRTADTLFILFAVAFWLLALTWFLLALFHPDEDSRPYVYGIRLVAFILIIVAIVNKNRSARPS
jgi:hypothetical protein